MFGLGNWLNYSDLFLTFQATNKGVLEMKTLLFLSSVLLLLSSTVIHPQTQHNIWYGFGPYGGTVSEISTNSMGNIAAITNGGLSYYYYEWIHMYNTQEFTHTTFLGASDTLIASDLDSLYWTADVSYHW